MSRRAADRLGINAERVNWFSTYHVHHRVANQFRAGRVFLVGDAAHIHSPVGGQGMNTGIGDAVNLAWKLSDVLQHPASSDILDTYQPERIAFARRLVATTDRGFTFITRDGVIARFVRRRLFPALLPGVMAIMTRSSDFSFGPCRKRGSTTASSALSQGRAGSIHGGDRLPWIPPADGDAADNFTPLEIHGLAAARVRRGRGEPGASVCRSPVADARLPLARCDARCGTRAQRRLPDTARWICGVGRGECGEPWHVSR